MSNSQRNMKKSVDMKAVSSFLFAAAVGGSWRGQ